MYQEYLIFSKNCENMKNIIETFELWGHKNPSELCKEHLMLETFLREQDRTYDLNCRLLDRLQSKTY